MAEEQPNLSRRTGSFPLQDRQQSLPQRRNDSLRHFADTVRHIPPHDRERVHFVAEPEEFGPYETTASNPYRQRYIPNTSPTTRVGGGYINSRPVYDRSIPVDSAPYSRFQVPGVTGRERSRRSTADSYVSDRIQPSVPMRQGRGRVRFAEPETSPRRPYYSPSSSPPPQNDYTRADDLSDSEDVDGVEYGTEAAASYRTRSRSRSRSRPTDYRAYQSTCASELGEDEEEGYDELLGGNVFQFVPSRNSRSLSKSGHSIDTDVSLEKSEDGTISGRDEPNISNTGKIFHVFQSQYTGDAVSEGTHTAKLTVIHDPKKQRQPLFRWMHLEQRMMNLDELSTEISRIPSVTDSERNGFAKLLAEVRKTSVKVRPTSKGSNVRHMDPRSIRVTIPPDGRSKSQTSRFLTWLCVPYFSLEKYSGLLSASTASSFPIETLLQSEYGRTTQERDMQQAACQNGEVPEGNCFHISQLWCIVLDNSLLITCGRMSSSSLRGDLVRIVNEPLKEPIGKVKTVYVSYYDTVLWALPLESCLTWFDFSIQFHEFWPQATKFYYHGSVVTETDWPRIVNMVRNVNTKVILDLRLWFHPQPPAAGVLQHPEQELEVDEKRAPEIARGKKSDVKPKLHNRTDDSFHVFSWLEMAETETDGEESEVETLTSYLQEAEDYLLRSMLMRDRTAYHNCNVSSQNSVHDFLVGKGLKIETLNESSQEEREYDSAVDLYNAAGIVFSFFLPLSFDKDTPTAGKFWGAIQSLVEASSNMPDVNEDARAQRTRPSRRTTSAQHYVYPLRSTLRGFTRVIQSFRGILSHAPAPVRTKVEMPNDLVRAWLHLVIALIQASQNEEAWNENIIVAEALIQRGMNDIMDQLPTPDLLSNSVIQPMELVALMSLKLLRDSTGTYSRIDDTYSDYLKGLENEITTNNSDRSHQLRIALFKQEVAVIRRVITSQLKVIDGMTVPQRPGLGDQTRREKEMLEREREKSKAEACRTRSRPYDKQGTAYVDRIDAYESSNPHYLRSVSRLAAVPFDPVRDPDAFSKLASTDPGGFRELLGRECRSWLERRDEEFLELDVEASRLEDMNANKIEVTKDRQEAAVYAFTMVTIIFLPLSTISSIFGMNSSDIRDMDLGQWAYWATALPTTVAVIVTGLWWMGELRNFVDWLRGIPSRRIRGYARVPPPAANGVIYYPQPEYPGIDPQAIIPYSRATLGPPVPRTPWRY
ncbi:hypothetical protein F4781DRAFT_70403 [Annulohypoxylon bovei var. microspora]|nr:hypothetical protein F4781DRAFT_70403 [Annulohypoxylon bovei var. microspora]